MTSNTIFSNKSVVENRPNATMDECVGYVLRVLSSLCEITDRLAGKKNDVTLNKGLGYLRSMENHAKTLLPTVQPICKCRVF